MLFKTLEIQGFKSFADKTVLEFDTRTTAVVGSNGNGKSNISDALRWVMGETGAKSLRGDNMEELIFHGTSERRPMGFARVVLTIDNSDRTLPVDADEVMISRKITRSGESEYLINNEKKRLRDIQELLMGTGLGRDGYSIIGQGRVSEIISARDTQRREIFEEAAGVSLFLHKKAEAEKQLAQAENNITRQRDIIRIDEEQLPTLEKQSEKAILATELLGKKKNLEISVSVARLKEKSAELSEISDGILLNKGECENFERDIAAANEKIENYANDKLSLQGRLEEIRADIESANSELSEKQTEIAVARNNIERNGERRRELDEQLKTARQSSAEFDTQIAAVNKDIEDRRAKAAESERKAAENRKLLDEISRRDSESGAEYSELGKRLAAARSEEARQESVKGASVRVIEDITAQRESFLGGISESEERLEEYKNALAEQRARAVENKERRDTLNNKSAGMERLAEGKRRRRDALREELERFNSEINGKQQKYNALSDIEKNHVGYYRPVKEVLSAGEQGRITGIHGIVADVISVPRKYVTAVETALGSVMQNVIVDNEETAARCIRFLKETNSGRATFYPITSMKSRTLNEPRLADETGFEGLAVELVECDKEYAGIIGYLLGMTAIVDDIDTASYIGKKYGYRFRIVTLDGQVVNAGGSFTGGARINKDGGIISQKQELESLHAEIARLRESAKERSEEYERVRGEAAKFDHELEGINEALSELDKSDISTAAEIKRLESLIEQFDAQEETRRAALKKFDDSVAEQKNTISAADEKLQKIAAEIKRLESELEAREGSRAEVRNKIDEISEKIRVFTDDMNSALSEISVLRQKIEGIENNRRLLAQNSEEYRKTQSELDESDRLNREIIERVTREISEREGQNDSRRGEISELNKKIVDTEGKITSLHNDIGEYNHQKERFSRELARLEERNETVQRDYDKIVALLYDSYTLTVSQAQEQAEIPEDLRAAEIELADVTKRITALGSVNMAAIEQFKTVSERYKFRSQQLKDIENSKRELEKIIEDLTEDIKTRFLESFNDINRHFKEIFVQIFGLGAHAELELTNPEDVLSSGIEIKAAPPGKVIKNLISLSGGEQAMVAITIYFAILMHRPTPFCMLDEVDAPLDVINVEKYIRYVNQFSNKTQLMLISHRRGTIEGCSVLYGVFMQEKGVSRLIKQELTDDLEGVSN